MPIANTRLAALELLEEGLEPHDVGAVYLAIPDRATTWVPLEPADMEDKIAAMRAHKSQMGDWDASKMIRDFAAQSAVDARANGTECELAESFVYIGLNRGPSDQPPE